MESTIVNNGNDYFMQKQIEMMIDMATKKMAADIVNLNNTVNKLNFDIAELKQQLRSAPIQRTIEQPRVMEQPRVAEQPRLVEQPKQTMSQKIDESARPRYGDYKPEDVSINKFFYYGTKR